MNTKQKYQVDDLSLGSDDSIKETQFPLVIPLVDNEGYTKSFSADQEGEYMNFWETYGFVIIDHVIDQQGIVTTIDDVWNSIESFDWTPYKEEYKNNKVARNNSLTWENTHFPTSQEGFFGLEIATTKQAFLNRQNETFYKVCSKILGKKNLWISIDRYGIMRPTKNISVGKFSSEKTDRISGVDVENSQLPTKDFLHWKTKSQWLHWDLNPCLDLE